MVQLCNSKTVQYSVWYSVQCISLYFIVVMFKNPLSLTYIPVCPPITAHSDISHNLPSTSTPPICHESSGGWPLTAVEHLMTALPSCSVISILGDPKIRSKRVLIHIPVFNAVYFLLYLILTQNLYFESFRRYLIFVHKTSIKSLIFEGYVWHYYGKFKAVWSKKADPWIL